VDLHLQNEELEVQKQLPSFPMWILSRRSLYVVENERFCGLRAEGGETIC